MTKTNETATVETTVPPPESDGRGKPPVVTAAGPRPIEEHAKKAGIDTATLAAVMQSEKWAVGKSVPKTEFKAAVGKFLGASMGGE